MVYAGHNDNGGGDVSHRHRGGRIGRGAIPKLAVRVKPPALECAVAEVGAGMGARSCNGSGSGDVAHLHRGGRGCRGPIPKLASSVIPPALDRAVV